MHIFWCYIFINVYKYDIIGVSIATLFTYTTLFIIITAYGSLSEDIKECWVFPNQDTFKDIPAYLRLAVPGALMVCAEWWTFEILTLMSGYLGVD